MPPRTKFIECLDCDAEFECDVFYDYDEPYTDIPSECPNCGASMDYYPGDPSEREDFHSDG